MSATVFPVPDDRIAVGSLWEGRTGSVKGRVIRVEAVAPYQGDVTYSVVNGPHRGHRAPVISRISLVSTYRRKAQEEPDEAQVGLRRVHGQAGQDQALH